MGKPSSRIATKKPPIQAAASAVRRRASSGATSSESWKSAAADVAVLPSSSQRISPAARQRRGIEITRGKSFALSGQARALKIPHPLRTRIDIASAREALFRLGTAAPPQLEDRVADDADGDGEKDEDDRPREPGGVVARHRD